MNMIEPNSDWLGRTRQLGPHLRGTTTLPSRTRQGEIATLKQHRFLSMAIPTELGGGGATWAELWDTLAELVRWAPGVALPVSIHTHLVVAGVLRFKRSGRGEDWLRNIARDESLLARCTEDEWSNAQGRLERAVGGYRVHAQGLRAHGLRHADQLVVGARHGRASFQFPLELDQPEVVRRPSRALSIRRTRSSIDVEGAFVSDPVMALQSLSAAGA